MVSFSIDDLRTPESLERVLRQFQTAIPNLQSIPTVPTIGQLVSQIAPLIRNELQAGGAAPLNLQSLLPLIATTGFYEDIHANRLTGTYTPPSAPGLAFYETDRQVLYLSQVVGGSVVWVYTLGVYVDTFANRPTDLGTNDTGFLYIPTVHLHWCRWSGTAWLIIDDDGGTFKESVRALGAGYQLCDGTATSYLTASGATLVETAFTTPDETSNGAARTTFHRSSNVYSGTVTPATTPGFAGTIDSAGTGISTGSGSFSTVAASATALTPPLTDPGHTHGVTGLTVTLPDSPVQYLNVLVYLRR